jgi:ethanolaminephosphotransferase
LISGLATFEETDEHAAPAVFDKVIFMVVDALRRYDWYRTPLLFGANGQPVTLYIQMTPGSCLHKGQRYSAMHFD